MFAKLETGNTVHVILINPWQVDIVGRNLNQEKCGINLLQCFES